MIYLFSNSTLFSNYISSFTKFLFIAFILLQIIFSEQAYASVKVIIEAREITLGETVDLTIETQGMSQGNITPPVVDGLDFNVVGNSKSQTIINGRSTVKNRITMRITPERSGIFQVPKIAIDIDGKKMQAQGFTLTVQEPQQFTNQQVEQLTPRFFIKRSVNKNQIYVKQPIIETIELFARAKIESLAKFGKNNPLVKIIENDNPTQSKQIISDKTYDVIKIQRVIIPLKSAPKTNSGSYGIEISYVHNNPKGSANFFGFSFSTSIKTKRISSKPDDFTVKTLPYTQVPDSFSGFVGDITLSANLSETQLELQKSTTLNIIFEGSGWISSLKAKDPYFSDDFKIYPDKPLVDEKIDEKTGLSGKKTFSYVLIPLKAGSHQLGSYQWSYFDISSQSYKTLLVDLGKLDVQANTSTSIAAKSQNQKHPTNTLEAEDQSSGSNLDDDQKSDENIENKASILPRSKQDFYYPWYRSIGSSYLFIVVFILIYGSILIGLAIASITISARNKKTKAIENWGSTHFVKCFVKDLKKSIAQRDESQLFETLCIYLFNNNKNLDTISAYDLSKKINTLNIESNDQKLLTDFIKKYEHNRYLSSKNSAKSNIYYAKPKNDALAYLDESQWKLFESMISRIATTKTFKHLKIS